MAFSLQSTQLSFIINLRKGHLNILAILNCILSMKLHVPEIFIHSVDIFKIYKNTILVDMHRILYIAFKQTRMKTKNRIPFYRQKFHDVTSLFCIQSGFCIMQKSCILFKEFLIIRSELD